MIIIILLVCSESISSSHFPNATISNKLIHAKLYLPNAEAGYYQSTRFDWSGIIFSLEYKGHNYFGQWFDYHDPKKHDAVCGPVDEFGAVGYENAKVGERFLKIGVGMLKRTTDAPYNSFTYYNIENSGERFIKKKANAVEFIHILEDTSGYAYEYRKTVSLITDQPKLVISYCLKNTGTQKIETTAYNHNFFMIDNQPIGQDVAVYFPFELKGDGLGVGEFVQLTGNEIKFLKQLKGSDRVLIKNIKGFNESIADHSYSIENHRTGAGVKLIGDKPLDHLVFWSCSTTLCPEPYIRIEIKPGEEFTWQNTYEFYTD